MGVRNTSDGSRNTAWDYVLTSAALAVAPSKFLDCQDTFSNASAQFSFPSAPATISVNLEGSMDGSNWTVLATSTAVTTNTVYSVGVPFRLLRANVTAFSGGSSPTLTVVVSAQSTPYGGSAAGSGSTVVANQGTPNTAANGWPVKVTDGTNTANVTAGPGASNNAILVTEGSVNSVTSLTAATTTVTGTVADFAAACQSATFQVVIAGTVTAGALTFFGSVDNTTFVNLGVAQLASSGITAANPYTPVTSTNVLFHYTGLGVRYLRADVTTSITGGATATVKIMGY
jgi:hypothetical protein